MLQQSHVIKLNVTTIICDKT